MGYEQYSMSDRSIRAQSLGYATKSINDVFEQNVKQTAHTDMNPKGVRFRECRDSEAHPNALPIQLYLDVTGSMGHIPHNMIKEGLPSLMSDFLTNGLDDVSLMFGAIGDHITDRYPLQVGQFESGDAELDMWLTRTFLEGRGGGNGGESYPLAWYFSGKHVQTDSFDKRNKKGYVFTVGDEPYLDVIPENALRSIMGDTAISKGTYTAAELLNICQRKNHVYHVFIEHGSRKCDEKWRELLGDNLIVTKDYLSLSKIISNIVLENEGITPPSSTAETVQTTVKVGENIPNML